MEEAIDTALIAAKTMTGATYWVSPAVPLEDSSGNRRRLGHITKQGSRTEFRT